MAKQGWPGLLIIYAASKQQTPATVQKETKEPRRFGEAYLSLMEDRRPETKSNDDWAQLGLLRLQLQRMEGSPVQDANAPHRASGGPGSSPGCDANQGQLKQIT